MPSLLDLPLSIHELILKHHIAMVPHNEFEMYEDSDLSSDSSSDLDLDMEGSVGTDDQSMSSSASEGPPWSGLQWPPRQMCSKTFFPYNIASACQIWYDILIKIPDIWRYAIFDVSESPSRFLDVFSWTGEYYRIHSLLVYSSNFLTWNDQNDLPDDESEPDWCNEETQELENSRVFDIIKAISNSPHFFHFERVAFLLSFNCSLPPPVVFMVDGPDFDLKVLVLRCSTLDCPSSLCMPHLSDNHWELRIPDGVKPIFPLMLTTLHLNGERFMSLVTDPQTSHLFQAERAQGFRHIAVEHFRFDNQPATSIQLFLVTLCNLKPEVVQIIRFYGLDYLPDEVDNNMAIRTPPTIPDSLYILKAPKVLFDDVSKSFIEEFDKLVRIHAIEEVRFRIKICTIPFISRMLSHHTPFLTLMHIHDVTSLKNAMCSWTGYDLLLDDCTFNDDFLVWLQEFTIDDRPPAFNMTSLTIEDCPNFTAQELINLLRLRRRTGVRWDLANDMEPTISSHYRITDVMVLGRCPILTAAEREYLRSFPDLNVNWASH